MKTAPWLLVEPGALQSGREVSLDSAEVRHALGALRLASGAEIVLTDGAGSVARGELAVEGRRRAVVRLSGVRALPKPAGGLTLAVGILAGSSMDLVVQKAVELGVTCVLPVICRRSQHGAGRAAARAEHWRRIARQALKQCHRAWELEIAAAESLEAIVGRVTPGSGIVGRPDGSSPDEIVAAADSVLLVGPEGGFAPEEGDLLDDARWQRLRLGPHILRAETAAIAGSAVVMAAMEGGSRYTPEP